MTNKRVLMGLAALGGLGALAFIGAIASWWWLAVAGLAAMLGVIGVVALNTNLLVRAQRSDAAKLRSAVAGGPRSAQGSAQPGEHDLTGTIRLLQAQYVGRLDRAQSSLERATADLEARIGTGAAHDDPYAALPHGSVVLLHRLDEKGVSAAKTALSHGLEVRAVVADSADRERLEAAGIGDAVTVVTDASDAPYALTVALPES
ncbi:MAG TPA: hypothetical protein P5314_04435 [Tetrasphaera sp.]|nr:hypothetical protein [Tetrasphaera sp.]